MKVNIPNISAVTMLTIGTTIVSAQENDRGLAAQLLKTSLECPIKTVKTKEDGNFNQYTTLTTKNVVQGNSTNFVMVEMIRETETSDGENYDGSRKTHVAFDFKQIGGTSINGSKVTAVCKGRRKCIRVRYDGGPPHDLWWEDYSKVSPSYRFSTCGAGAAQDIADALEFLSGGSK